MSLKADLDALEKDAGTWDGVSSALESASGLTWDLTLSTGDLSWAADVVGLTTAYSDYLAEVRRLLSEGQTATNGIAQALREIRRAYADTDTHNAERMKLAGHWDPI